jgi:uncharacterized protein (TIGR02301 family)
MATPHSRERIGLRSQLNVRVGCLLKSRHRLRDRCVRTVRQTVGIGCLATTLMLSAAVAQQSAPALENRPYDEKLLRLSEVLGAVHFLRELCGGTDGQLWRERMRELLDAEGSSALRKAKLTRSFNNGYRSYSRTYTSCTPSAQTAIARFIGEAADIAETLVKTVP